ncbi:MAG: hypothetical protein A2Y40_08055 [Candidatus Margulisbacteria bacterium GWF2_35_9]|nr:MAG: hypothetical protein A2Y40_08055 [Candidatus Margulisbacteria bacterium GWF2_35_9]
MNAEYVNPFLTAVSEVFRECYPNIDIKRGNIKVQEHHLAVKGCASIICITGQIEGRVVIDMKLETAILLAEDLLGEKHEIFDMDVSSSINEIANMICGKAISMLANKGMDVDISSPTLFTGMNMELYDSNVISDGIMIPLETTYGQVDVNVAIAEQTAL